MLSCSTAVFHWWIQQKKMSVSRRYEGLCEKMRWGLKIQYISLFALVKSVSLLVSDRCSFHFLFKCGVAHCYLEAAGLKKTHPRMCWDTSSVRSLGVSGLSYTLAQATQPLLIRPCIVSQQHWLTDHPSSSKAICRPSLQPS